jgi:hypothetical protein
VVNGRVGSEGRRGEGSTISRLLAVCGCAFYANAVDLCIAQSGLRTIHVTHLSEHSCSSA